MKPALISIMAVFFGTTALAQSADDPQDLAGKCDALAASPIHPSFPRPDGAPEIWISDIDTASAIPACEQAVAQDPENARLLMQLGRSYEAAERYEEAAESYQKAVDLGDEIAVLNLAWAYQEGQGVAQSSDRFFELANQLVQSGTWLGDLVLGEAYWFGHGAAQDYGKALDYMREAAAKQPESALPYEYIASAYDAGLGVDADATQAVMWYKKAAELGSGDAMANLGWYYENGTGVDADAAAAERWYRQASEDGVIWATDNLAYLLYFGGDGVEVDAKEALRLWQMVADGDDPDRAQEALVNIGWAYLDGVGVAQDTDAALASFRSAAERGSASAMHALGLAYLNGAGVDVDEAAAFEWNKKGAEAGYASAEYTLAYQYFAARGTVRNDAEAVRLAQGIIDAKNEASLGHALNLTGIAYELGRGVPRDVAQAVARYKEAAEHGNAYARMNLAAIYRDGDGGFGDPAEALRILSDLYENGPPKDFAGLGSLYEMGVGVEVDLPRAVALFREGVAEGDTDSMWRLALLLEAGKGVAQDGAQAEALLRQAMADHNHLATYHLAAFFERGLAVEADPAKAAEFFEMSLAYGRPDALDRDEADWTQATLQQLQERLKARGIYDGPSDGVMNAATKAALLAVQQAG